MRKLNMWQRLGIVASVLWIIGGGFWQRNSDYHKALDFMGASYSLWTEVSSQRGNYDFKQCSEQIDHDFEIMMEGSWGNAALFAFGPVLLGWLLAWVSIRVGRWVLAGRDRGEG